MPTAAAGRKELPSERGPAPPRLPILRASMDSPPRRALGLLLALALYFGLRALILASNFDEVSMPQFELFPMGTIPLLW
jgi:hypothetical protein